MNGILQKMMSKAPSDRYQSLYGVIRDFEALSEALLTTHPAQGMLSYLHSFAPNLDPDLESFRIASYDRDDEFHLSKIYGREQQSTAITSTLEQFEKFRSSSVLFVAGPSGVGKSSIVKHFFGHYQR